MTNITAYDKERMLKNIKHWYQSHKQSVAHYQETGNEKAVEYQTSVINLPCSTQLTEEEMETVVKMLEKIEGR